MTTATTSTMIDAQALQRLLAWASPAFPIGAFAYSAGLETAIAERRVADAAATRVWIEGNLGNGAARNDAVLAATAWRERDSATALGELADLCLALTPSLERHREMLGMGEAFVAAAGTWPDPVYERLPPFCPYPVAFGAVAGAAGISVKPMLIAFLTSYLQAQVSVAVRLVPIGQRDGLAIFVALEPAITAIALSLGNATLEDLGSAAYAADIAVMRHETLSTRIFRS